MTLSGLMGSAARPQPQHPRREQILAEATRLFVSHGVAQVTTRQIAAAVGISQPSLYAHFPTREAIAVEVCRRAFARLRTALLDAAAQGSDPPARFAAMARCYIDFGLNHECPYRVAFMLDMPGQDSADRDVVVAAGVAAYAVLRDVIAQTHGAAADLLAQSAWSSLHGLVALLIARRDFPWVEREALITRHIAGVRAALYGC
jgi:AcrR family transcriptional regulator